MDTYNIIHMLYVVEAFVPNVKNAHLNAVFHGVLIHKENEFTFPRCETHFYENITGAVEYFPIFNRNRCNVKKYTT